MPLIAEAIKGIRFHLNGEVEVLTETGDDWHPFKGMVINAALVELEFQRNAQISLKKKAKAELRKAKEEYIKRTGDWSKPPRMKPPGIPF
jgi:hypothetical protein